MSPATTYYLFPASDPWVQKLGAGASITTQSGGTSSSSGNSSPVNQVLITSLDKALNSQTVTAYVSVQAISQ